MNSVEVKEYLLKNVDKLEELLLNIGLSDIHNRTNEIRCAYKKGLNPTSIRIKLNENLSYENFGNNTNGDIYTLVMDKMGLNSFREGLLFTCEFLGFSATYNKIEKPKIFGGIFKNYTKQVNNTDYDMKTYDVNILNNYEQRGNALFQRDGINLKTQRKYKIGYDWYTHRITIPEFNCEGELVGITSRYNGDDFEEQGEPKYFPLIEFPKRKVLFGYNQNYNDLQGNNIWLVESQKSVMKMDSVGKTNFLALGGRVISPIQIKYIQNLNPKSVIVALDEGIDEGDFIKMCEELKPKSSLINYKVGYLYDKDNEYLKKGSKDSPCDLSLSELKKFSKKVKWV